MNGGEPVKINSFDMDTRDLALSPDGKQIAFIASTSEPINSYTEPDLWVADVTPNSKPRNLTANFDWDVANGVSGDNAAPRGFGGNVPIWTADGTKLIELYGREGKSNLGFFDVATGTETDITQGKSGRDAVSRHPRWRKARRTALRLPRGLTIFLHSTSPATEPRQLTHSNDELFSQLNLTPAGGNLVSELRRKRIQSWVQKPPGFDASKKYPLILNIHGGPHAAYGFVFDHEFQWMAAKGYVVLYPNPRGSTSYGQDFGNIIQYHYPGDDYPDLMAGVDELVRRGYIDSTSSVSPEEVVADTDELDVGHTDRFAAAVSQRDISIGPMVVYGRFLALSPGLVQSTALRRRRRFQSALSDHLHQQGEDAPHAGSRRR